MKTLDYFYYMKPHLKIYLKINNNPRFIYPILSKNFIRKIEEPDLSIGVLIVANFLKAKKLLRNF